MKLIAKGAESNLYLDDDILIKYRVPKKYRIKGRTRSIKFFLMLCAQINVPRVIGADEKENKIFMEFVEGRLLKDLGKNIYGEI